MIKFEKVSFDEFSKYVNSKEEYDNYILPKRGSDGSVGYDFYSIVDFTLKPGEITKEPIPTGVKVIMPKDVGLFIHNRSSVGFKGVRLLNVVAVIDSDYYGHPETEGHILLKLINEGDKEFVVKKGDKLVQGVFEHCLYTDDDMTNEKRDGWSYLKERRNNNE